MSLQEKILSDMKTAMKERKEDRLRTLRFLQSSIKNKIIELRPNEITEKDVISVLQKAVKQRKESIEQFEKAGRNDLAQTEKVELDILNEYLPQQMSEAELDELVGQVIADLNANSIKQMGAVIKEAMSRANGLADGKLVSELVKKKLPQ